LLMEHSDSKFKLIKDDTRTLQNIWGYRDGSTYYVLPMAYNDHLIKGFEEKTATKALFNAGMLARDAQGRYVSKKRTTDGNKSYKKITLISVE